jgi:murein DD-endopeptidase / murein LD-carboxypeptidase
MEPHDPRALIGVPFRLHGRDVASGLDCVGVVALVLGETIVPTGYRLRQGSSDLIEAGLIAAGLNPVGDPVAADILLIAVGPAQFHLAVMTDAGFVHACAGLRRVVETPGMPTTAYTAWRRCTDFRART